jgi:hypothetical protein
MFDCRLSIDDCRTRIGHNFFIENKAIKLLKTRMIVPTSDKTIPIPDNTRLGVPLPKRGDLFDRCRLQVEIVLYQGTASSRAAANAFPLRAFSPW